MNLITRLSDFDEAMREAECMARKTHDDRGMIGFGVAHLLDGDGRTKQLVPFSNLITTAGDQYYAKIVLVGVPPANATLGGLSVSVANGMKLGTATTAAHKSTAGAAAIASGGYISGSNVAFDATYPQAAAIAGTDTGWNTIYKTTWAAGVATSATINEAAIVNDQATNTTASVANTYARGVLSSTVNKGASDALAITWNHKSLGA